MHRIVFLNLTYLPQNLIITSKRVNPSKSPLRKFDPKTVLSPLIGKRK